VVLQCLPNQINQWDQECLVHLFLLGVLVDLNHLFDQVNQWVREYLFLLEILVDLEGLSAHEYPVPRLSQLIQFHLVGLVPLAPQNILEVLSFQFQVVLVDPWGQEFQ
jgi:hypothetical protein